MLHVNNYWHLKWEWAHSNWNRLCKCHIALSSKLMRMLLLRRKREKYEERNDGMADASVTVAYVRPWLCALQTEFGCNTAAVWTECRLPSLRRLYSFYTVLKSLCCLLPSSMLPSTSAICQTVMSGVGVMATESSWAAAQFIILIDTLMLAQGVLLNR